MNYIIAMSIASFSISAAVGPYFQLALRNKGYSQSLVGMIMALAQISAIMLPLIIGNISDKQKKRKYLLIMCAIGTFTGYGIGYLTGSIYLTLISIFFGSGFFWSILPLQDSLIVGYYKGDSIMYSKVRSLGTASFIVVLVLFVVTHFPNKTSNISISLAITGLSLSLVIITFILPKSVEKESFNMPLYVSIPNKVAKKCAKKGAKEQWYDPGFKLLLFIIALSRFTNSIPDRLIASYMVENLHMGSFFVLFFAWGATTEFFLMRIAGKSIQQKKVQPWVWILVGSMMEAVRIAFYVLIPNTLGLFLGQSLNGLTFGAFHIGVMSYISSHVDTKHFGKALSWYWSGTVNFPVAIGAFFGGFIIENFGYTTLFLAYIPASILASILCFINRKKFICK